MSHLNLVYLWVWSSFLKVQGGLISEGILTQKITVYPQVFNLNLAWKSLGYLHLANFVDDRTKVKMQSEIKPLIMTAG